MDACSVAALIPTEDQVKTFLATIGTIVTIASAICAMTPTPAPGTRAARVYRCLELAALILGRAKDAGTLPKLPPDKTIADAVALVRKSSP